MLSRLRYAYGTNVPPTPAREYAYDYDKAGNLTHCMFNNYNPDQESHAYFSYAGDLRTGGSGGAVGWYDLNGRQTSQLDDHPDWFPFEYDWDGNLLYGQYMNPTLGMEAKYDPDGVRIYKHRIWNLDSYWHKYIVDTTDDLPKILLVLDANDNNTVLKTYVHASNQIIAQHDGDYTPDRYFYLHDRLGSVRQIINSSGDVANCYYYTPWGSVTGSESDETVSNWYGWAGYLSDEEIGSYYCNARQYNAARFMTRDPVAGKFKEPMTLHKYLYCLNDPSNRIDPTGETSLSEETTVLSTGSKIYSGYDYSSQALDYARRVVAGASIRGILLDAGAQVVLNYGMSKGLDFLSKLGNKAHILVKDAMRRHGHHVWPNFLGGAAKGAKEMIDDNLHRAFHERLKDDLVEEFGLDRAAKNWSSGVWDKFLQKGNNRNRMVGVLWDTTSEFDAEFGTSMLSSLMETLMDQL